jgi:WD40 repeat protein
MTGAEQRVLAGHGHFITGLAFSPDGARLAAASWFRALSIWDGRTYQSLVSFGAHDESLRSVAFAPDGQRIATAGADRTIRIWDARSRAERRRARSGARAASERAASLVDHLESSRLTPDAIADAIDEDATIDAAVRHAALNELLGRSARTSARGSGPLGDFPVRNSGPDAQE